MNAPLRRVGVVVMILFGLLFVNLNYVQAIKADEYRNSDYNARVQVAEYERKRGIIEAAGTPLTASKETDGTLKYLRTYPKGEIYAHVVGYKPVNLADTGVERSENEFLAGTSDQLLPDRLWDLFTGKQTPGGDVLLTISPRAQEAAFKGLADNRVGATKGAAVALDPRTGAIQALVSMPSFDPNPLADHDTKRAQEAYDRLVADKDGPLRNRVLSETFPPGSTMKVIVAAAALKQGYTPQTRIPAGSSWLPPTAGQPIRNAAASICPESEVTLLNALTESCNTGFARLGVKLGAQAVKDEARRFGFEDEELTVGRLNGDGQPDRGHARPGRPGRPAVGGPVLDRPERRPDDAAAGGDDRRRDRQQRPADAAVPGGPAARPGPHHPVLQGGAEGASPAGRRRRRPDAPGHDGQRGAERHRP